MDHDSTNWMISSFRGRWYEFFRFLGYYATYGGLNRRFGTPCRFHLQGWSRPRRYLKMGPIGSPETSVLNHLTPRYNPKDERIQGKMA
jgi:hypothetical protein